MRNFVARQTGAIKKSPPAGDEKKAPAGGVAVYDDTDVCRLIGKRRRVLVAARTRDTRGVDWDVIGAHAGMSRAWIEKTHAGADAGGMRPVAAGDGVTTLRVAAKVLNHQRMVCERVSDGMIVIASVKDSTLFRVGDQFDAVMEEGRYRYDAALNSEAY